MAEEDNQVQVDPEVEALYDDAMGEVAIGEVEAAVVILRQCVERAPKYFDGWHALGMALMKTGDVKGAIGAALMATHLQPNDLLAWTALSQMYVAQGDIAAAEAAKQNATILGIGGKVVK